MATCLRGDQYSALLGTSERDIVNEKIYILLPVHNRRETTSRFISSLNAQSYRNFHLVLIDDGSTDGTAEMVRESVEPLTVIRGSGNWWWAGSLQQGYDWLQSQNLELSDLVLMINDDTEFTPEFLQSAVHLMQDPNRTILVAWCYCRETGRLVDAGVHVDWSRLAFQPAAPPHEINCLSTNGLFMRLSDLFATGGFRPALLPHYASDYEFTIRAHRMGMRLTSDPACHLRLDQGTTGYHELYAGSMAGSLRRIFSRRSTRNPFMWCAFILLSCPWRYWAINIYRAWANFLYDICRLAKFQALDWKRRLL